MQNRPRRWWDLPAAFFLLASLMVVAFRLGDTDWTEHLDIVSTTTLLGCLLGLALGYSAFKRWIAFLIGLGYTITVLPWQLTAQVDGKVAWLERLSSLGGRLWAGLQSFFQNQPLTDPLPFLTNMVVLFWLVSLISGYNLVRHGRPWHGVLVAGVALVAIDIYHPELGKGGLGMAVFLIFALLLLTRMYFLANSKRWEEQRFSVDADTGWTFGRGALVTAVLLILLAWNVTTIARAFTPATRERREVVNFWRSLRQRFENITAPLSGSVPLPVEYFDDEFSLGTGAVLTDDPVMTVTTDIGRRIGVNYYWKMRTYDRYLNGRWYSTLEQIKGMQPGDPSIDIGPLRGRMPVNFRIRTQRNMSMLVAPSMTLAVSRPVTLVYGPAEGETIDLVAVEIDPMLRIGETYEVYARVSAPTIAQLKAAGSDYPAWVRNSYLQVPITLPESIKNLALEITEGLETPYEKVAAITAWLRNNIDYSAVIPIPPDGVDVIEWVLFTEKKAFCNYYATAEVLMLRSLGIPARWAVGYAQGAFNEEKKQYEVLARDSHAWPEVYFPGYGWIEFEPTASQPEINRPSGDNSSSQLPLFDSTGGELNNLQDNEEEEEDPRLAVDLPGAESFRTIFQRLLPFILGAALLITIAVILLIRQGRRDPRKAVPVLIERAILRRGWRTPTLLRQWASYVRLTPIERAFISVEWAARLMGARLKENLTPTEQVTALIKALPAGEVHARRLLEEYEKAIYSPHPADLEAARQAGRALIRLAIVSRLKRIGEVILSGGTQSKTAREWDV